MQAQALRLLRQALDNNAALFRDGQWPAIAALVERRARLLVVQRTGWGKSLVYFLATRLLRDLGAGCTILISPLLSLMRNQIAAAGRIRVRAETINSTNEADWPQIEAGLHRNEIDVLLISPERLANDDFVNRCLLPIAGRVGLFVVDEAHCISDWGHDFRPNYRRIVRILRALPRTIAVLATTATANDRVVADIIEQLGPHLEVQRGPLTRASLSLQNISLRSQAERMAWLANRLRNLPGSGIIYTLTVRDSERLARWLQLQGIDAEAYYGALETEQREVLENRLLSNELKVLVATVALGMGFDKPDLGFVIHYQRPASVVHYYQQVGRAGRAVDNAYGVLLNGDEDDAIADYFIRTAFPTPQDVEQLLGAMRTAGVALTIPKLQQRVNLSRGKIDRILDFLLLESPAPIQKTEGGYVLNPVRWQMPTDRIERITNLRRHELDRMQAYVNNRDCLMQFLAEELNDPEARACGMCVNCVGQLLPEDIPEALAQQAVEFLDRQENPIEPRKQWPAAVTKAGMRGRIAAEHQASEGRALCRWGDPGYGEMVRRGKQRDHHFDDRLVEAAARLISNRWRPDPAPTWVTCVPSNRHQALVPDFARRLGQRLGLPFVQSIRKVRETEPQKTRANSFQQAQNLHGAFIVEPAAIRQGPVLLVDDMVDSRWTFAVASALLRQAGSGPVYPFALADTSSENGE
ncbi:MAG TPA: RecQ family ATP-dependent DNA helicase [Bryobacteraceae bacterium]|jgi:ATP-dependent DNA helicase RecQ|nr:RecQ family ATP-dependent DNA helicase [Bryobacteraceae bacterium]